MTDQATKLTQAFQNTCVHLEVSSRDVTTVDGAWGLVNQAQTLAPLGGLFHLQSVRAAVTTMSKVVCRTTSELQARSRVGIPENYAYNKITQRLKSGLRSL